MPEIRYRAQRGTDERRLLAHAYRTVRARNRALAHLLRRLIRASELSHGELVERVLLIARIDLAAARARNAYRDDSYPERACDHCGEPYRGPAVYCSINCAVADA